ESAPHFAAGKKARQRPPIRADHLGIFVDLEPSEGEGNATGYRVGEVGRSVELDGPVRLINTEPARGVAVLLGRVEDLADARGRIELFHGAQGLFLVVEVELGE